MKEYKKAGVDIQGSTEIKKEIKKLVKKTYNQSVLVGVGSFGAIYNLDLIKEYKQPVLVQSIDGVGTKLEIAKAMSSLSICGQDLVNHCINDAMCQGASPLFFMDYIAQDRLREQEISQIVEGMAIACKQAGIFLIGGETAQLPGVYRDGQLDVVGVITGVVERDFIIDGSKIRPGDVLLGLPSSGPHTNGYSLIRKIFYEKFCWLPYHFLYLWVGELNCRLGDAVLQTHQSYLRPITLLHGNQFEIHGIAHITGGGLPANISRILPKGCRAQIKLGSWPNLPIFQYIQKQGNISSQEMYRVFNMGIGMVLAVSHEESEKIMEVLWKDNQPCYFIGEIIQGKRGVNLYTRRKNE